MNRQHLDITYKNYIAPQKNISFQTKKRLICTENIATEMRKYHEFPPHLRHHRALDPVIGSRS